ncbi:uncharacterized mitochondrial protein AtMg00860-like [Helianthus annuus]|uniref:uncharacterized mitochondrial protein AtMg00860-like n=1 Tax=Helianthus annuus TaxID=4232 RepID=UPI000B8FCA71|nr:uncharacterized mitochondrial protein AtMg00860-like [Helianthus annuus]
MATSCPEKVTVCYNCYREGHKTSECQELVGKKDGQDTKGEAPKAKAISFQLTAAEAKVEPKVVSEVQFLGHIISADGVLVDPSKVEAVSKWNTPRNPSEIRRLLGLAGYYRRFIQDFSKIALPLTKLTRKEEKFVWGVEQEKAFQTLKEKLTHALVLTLSEGVDDMVVYSDASPMPMPRGN